MKVKKDISIIIVSYNVAELLKQCIKSILKNIKGLNFEIIIVDNNSSDNTADILKEFPKIKIIFNNSNLGFAKANNQALEIATGEYVCFLNPDTIVHSDAFEILINYVKNDSRIGAVGPMLLNKDGPIQYSAYYLPSIWNLIYRFFDLRMMVKFLNNLSFKVFRRNLVSLSTERNYDKPFLAEWIIGACILMPRKVVLTLGGFDEDYFLYWDEIDLCKRLVDEDYKIYVVPQAHITHLIGQSTINIKEFSTLQWYKGLFLFCKKHFSLLSCLLVKIFLSISILFNIIIGGHFLKKNYYDRFTALKILKIIWII